jgi:hypothetical protein
MKQYKFLSVVLSLTLVFLWSSCAYEEDKSTSHYDGQLMISVYDAGMENSDINSRAVTDLDYNTTFEVGDCLGVYAVKDGEILDEFKNVRVEFDGTNWKSDVALQYDEEQNMISYYAYYPYNQQLNITSVEEDFFAGLIKSWNPETDQSSKENYAAADLMTSPATAVQKELSGQYTIRFNMIHQMALAVVAMPQIEYQFTDPELNKIPYVVKVDGGEAKFYVRSLDGEEIKPYKAEDGSYRIIIKPTVSPEFIGKLGNKKFEIKTAVSGGKYKRFQVDGGKKIKEHELKVGDYYCADGSLVSATEEAPDNCIGIVYYVGNPQPSILYPDKEGIDEQHDALKRDHPNCVHGLVYALTNASDKLSRFGNGSSNNYSALFTDLGANNSYLWGNGNKAPEYDCILGYNNTEVIKIMEDSGTDKVADAMKALNGYISGVAVPAGLTTGWYLPSIEEISVIIENTEAIASSLSNVGGKRLWEDTSGSSKYTGYWTSSNKSGTFYTVKDGSIGDKVNGNAKNGQGYYRFALAF